MRVTWAAAAAAASGTASRCGQGGNVSVTGTGLNGPRRRSRRCVASATSTAAAAVSRAKNRTHAESGAMPYETNVSAKRPSAAVGWLVVLLDRRAAGDARDLGAHTEARGGRVSGGPQHPLHLHARQRRRAAADGIDARGHEGQRQQDVEQQRALTDEDHGARSGCALGAAEGSRRIKYRGAMAHGGRPTPIDIPRPESEESPAGVPRGSPWRTILPPRPEPS